MGIINKILGGNKKVEKQKELHKEIINYLYTESLGVLQMINPNADHKTYDAYVKEISPHINEVLIPLPKDEIQKLVDKISFISSYNEKHTHEITGQILIFISLIVTYQGTQNQEITTDGLLMIFEEVVEDLTKIHQRYT